MHGFDEVERRLAALPTQSERSLKSASRQMRASAYYDGIRELANRYGVDRVYITSSRRVFTEAQEKKFRAWFGILPIKWYRDTFIEIDDVDDFLQWVEQTYTPAMARRYVQLFERTLDKRIRQGLP